MRTEKNLPQHELIGLDVEIIGSENEYEIGIKGQVIDERKKILKIDTDDDEKTVRKDGREFRFKLPDGKSVVIKGDLLVARPEMRIKKRLKKW